MLEQSVIQQQGFENVVQEGRIIGFQVRARCPYYRGIWASLLERIEISVDGETFPVESTRVELAGKPFNPGEEADDPDLRWPFEEPALLIVDKPGGLEAGLHDLTVAVTWRWSYMPVEMQPTTSIAERRLALVR